MKAPPYHLHQQQLLPGPYYGSVPYQGGYFYPPQHQQPQQWGPPMGYPMMSGQWSTQQPQSRMPQVDDMEVDDEDYLQPPPM